MLSQKIVTGNDALSTTFRDARNSLNHTPSFAASDAEYTLLPWMKEPLKFVSYCTKK
jgi:hypothetical protein